MPETGATPFHGMVTAKSAAALSATPIWLTGKQTKFPKLAAAPKAL